jgi:osmotically-inducible protein OsmY
MRFASFCRVFIVAVSIVLSSAAAASAQKVDCNAQTDQDVVFAVMANLKVKFSSQMNHINIRSKDRVVTIEGWTTSKSFRNDIEKIVKKTKCVKKVDNKLTIGVGGGCGTGTKACGTICIPVDETCNIGATKGS